MECYYALAMDINDNENIDQRIQSMQDACSSIRTFQITQCVKSCVVNGIDCIKGEYVIIEKGKLIACVKDYQQAVQALKDKQVFEQAESCMIFTGIDSKDLDQEQYEQLLRQASDGAEIAFVDGQQRIYDLIIGVI